MLDRACRYSTGKLTRSALYIHRRALDECNPVVALHIGRAMEMGFPFHGVPDSYNIVKVARNGDSVSFLCYPNFDSMAHPELERSACVSMLWPDAPVKLRNYPGNKPILHRKEDFVSASDPLWNLFRQLTVVEQGVGLLDKAPGYKRQWERRLADGGWEIRGHGLYRRRSCDG